MPKYDYSILNDKEFEELVCDLLNEEFSLNLQSFKKGRDQGIDLRYSTSGNSNDTIVQAKQYTTNFKALFSNLKNEELRKVRLLKPKSYWIVTSLLLSASEKDLINVLFTGFMLNANHIISGNDLNRLLTKHKVIAKNWLKLWLTNTNILHRVINNAIYGRSEFYHEKIVSRIKLYVKNKSLYDAGQILRQNKFLLISGQPGVGKTTLADILTYEFLALKYQLIYIDKDIEEAGEVFDRDKNIPQIIYFDDFLGANHLEIMNLKSSESAIVRFIERVQTSKNKYMILTTRTTILKDAKENYEKLNRANIDLSKKELRLEDYTLEDKAKILYSHLYHSLISADFKKEVFKNKNYWKVIRHENYIPRLIEFFTKPYNLMGLKAEEYVDFMLQNLTNPREVWRHSFTKQLHLEDRFLICSLFSFGNYYNDLSFAFSYSIPSNLLQGAFEQRMNYEIKTNGFSRTSDTYNSSLRRLLDGYLISAIDKGQTIPRIKFLNPSITDFLTHYLMESNEEKWKVIYGTLYIEQLKVCFEKFINYNLLGYEGYNQESNKFIDFVWTNKDTFLPTLNLNERRPISYAEAFNCEMAALLHSFRLTDEVNERVELLTLTIFPTINLYELNGDCFDLLIPILEEATPSGVLYIYINENWDEIISGFWRLAGNDEDFEKIEELFKLYDNSLQCFASNSYNSKIISESLKTYIDDKNYSDILDECDEITREEDLVSLKSKIRSEREIFFERFYVCDPGFDESYYFDGIDTERNRIIKRKKKSAAVALITEDPHTIEKDNETKMVKAIDELFSKDWKNP